LNIMLDMRLLGTWRSDARRTAKEIRARRDIPEQHKRKLSGLFGKLLLRYTRTQCHSTFAGRTERLPYRVVAKDASSVAVVGPDLLTGEPRISHITFDGSHFWVNVGNGTIREFFKRVRPPNKALQPTSRARGKATLRLRGRAARG
jgi:hypothetical protein